MKRLLFPISLLSILLAGCYINYHNTAYDYELHLTDCDSNVRVEEGSLVSGITVVDSNKDWTLSLGGWQNGTCFPLLQNTDTRTRDKYGHLIGPAPVPTPQSAACNYTKGEVKSLGANQTLVLLLGRCGIPKAQSVLVFGSPFPQYQNSS